MTHLTRIIPAILLIACTACETQSLRPTRVPDRPATESVQSLLQRAARASDAEAAVLYLRAATLHFEKGDIQAADELVRQIDPALLGQTELERYLTLTIDLALANGDEQRAESAALQLKILSGEIDGRIVGAESLANSGNYNAAANQLIQLSAASSTPAPLHDLLWRYMGDAGEWSIRRGMSSIDPLARGWWALKYRMMTAMGVNDQRARYAAWRRQNPQHPATLVPPHGIRTLSDLTWRPRNLALFVPVSGGLGTAGRSVRDGAIAAYLTHLGSQDEDGAQPSDLNIRVYDTASAPLANLYEAALAQGADVIIGPLTKARVAELSRLQPVLPVIALNYADPKPGDALKVAANGFDARIPDGVPPINPELSVRPSPITAPQIAPRIAPGDPPQPTPIAHAPFWQLGLAIEDEARAIGRRLSTQFNKAVIFREQSDWADRANTALLDQLASTGTVQVETFLFNNVREITETVGRAMLVEASQIRADEIVRLLGQELEFVPRSRGDLDAVVAFVDSTKASALMPALNFHFAKQLPVFLSSQALQDVPKDRLAPFRGVWVSDLPWRISGDGLYHVLNPALNLDNNPLKSLYALGADGYLVAANLAMFSADPDFQLLGNTGHLVQSGGHRLERRLSGARVGPDGFTPPNTRVE